MLVATALNELVKQVLGMPLSMAPHQQAHQHTRSQVVAAVGRVCYRWVGSATVKCFFLETTMQNDGLSLAAIAQLGERQTEDLKVPGSIPGLGIYVFDISGICARLLHDLVAVFGVSVLCSLCTSGNFSQTKNDPGRTRTCNPRLRRPMPYPLGHGASCFTCDWHFIRRLLIVAKVSQTIPWKRPLCFLT